MIVNASAKRLIRWSNGNPNAANSVSFQPAPRPSDQAPAADLVDGGGHLRQHRRGVEGRRRDERAERDPRGDRGEAGEHRPGLPRPARAVVAGRRYSRWSPYQTESKPSSSARSAIARRSGQRASHSTSGSWMPTLRARPGMGTSCGDRRTCDGGPAAGRASRRSDGPSGRIARPCPVHHRRRPAVRGERSHARTTAAPVASQWGVARCP